MNVAYEFKNLIPAHIDSLDPIPHNSFHIIDDDDATIVTSNRSLGTLDTSIHSRVTSIPDLPSVSAMIPYLTSAARMSFDTSLHKRPGVSIIASTHAIADMGAMSIFIMEGTDVENKKVAVRPLTIICPMGVGSCRHMCVTSQYPACQLFSLDTSSRILPLHH